MVEELDNKYIDNTLNDVKSQNKTDDTSNEKTQSLKQETPPHSSKKEKKPTRTRAKSKKTKVATETKEELEKKETKPETEESAATESLRKEKVVEYDEPDYILREITIEDKQILIGPKRLTRFEKARITGARSLQISYGAPLMIKADVKSRSSISLAIEELEKKALPISIRRILPNGLYQDVPIEWLKT